MNLASFRKLDATQLLILVSGAAVLVVFLSSHLFGLGHPAGQSPTPAGSHSSVTSGDHAR